MKSACASRRCGRSIRRITTTTGRANGGCRSEGNRLLGRSCQQLARLDDKRDEYLHGDVAVVAAFVNVARIHEVRVSGVVDDRLLALVVEQHRSLLDASKHRPWMYVAAFTAADGHFSFNHDLFVAGHADG